MVYFAPPPNTIRVNKNVYPEEPAALRKYGIFPRLTINNGEDFVLNVD